MNSILLDAASNAASTIFTLVIGGTLIMLILVIFVFRIIFRTQKQKIKQEQQILLKALGSLSTDLFEEKVKGYAWITGRRANVYHSPIIDDVPTVELSETIQVEFVNVSGTESITYVYYHEVDKLEWACGKYIRKP